MSLEKVVPFENKEGNQYLLSFELYEPHRDYGIPIIYITLSLVSENKKLNHQGTFSFIIKEIQNYLNNNKVILHYYCDVKELFRRDMSISPQEFRSKLFNALFLKMDDDSLDLKSVVIEDEENGPHYLSVVSKKEDHEIVDLIIEDLNTFHKS